MIKNMIINIFLNVAVLSCLPLTAMPQGLGSKISHAEIQFDRLCRYVGSVESLVVNSQKRDSMRQVEKHVWDFAPCIFAHYQCDKSIFYGVEFCCYPIIQSSKCCHWMLPRGCKEAVPHECKCCYEIPEDIKLGCVMFIARTIVEDYKKQKVQDGSDNV